MKTLKKAVIPAAGFGTRFLPATKATPKEMLPIVDTPNLQYIVEECVAAGIDEILIILGKNKKCIEDHFDRSVELENLLQSAGKTNYLKMVQDISSLAQIFYVRQKEMKGSANAIAEAEAFVGSEPFAVLFGDDLVYSPQNPCIGQLKRAYEETGKTIVGVQSVGESETKKYGMVLPGVQKGRYTELKSIVEKPQSDPPSNLASMGRYIFNCDVFDAIRQTKPGKDGEIYLTDSIKKLASQDMVYAYTFEGRRYDIGDKQGFLEATVEYALRDNELKDDFIAYLKTLPDIIQKLS